MSSSVSEVVITTIGILRSAGSPLISASASRPSFFGMLRSSRISPGPGALPGSLYAPRPRR